MRMIGFSLLWALFLGACAPAAPLEQPTYARDLYSAAELKKMRNNFKKYIRCIPGHFRTMEHAALDEDWISRDMISIRVFEQQTDAVWTYTEVFATQLPSEPLAQLFYKHTRLNRDTFLMQPYTFRERGRLAAFRNEWKDPPYFEGVLLDDLVPLANCGVRIVADTNTCFHTIPPSDTLCALPLGERARYSTVALDYFENRIRLETNYFDAEKRFVGTANPGGSVYNRLSAEAMLRFYEEQTRNQGPPKKQLLRWRRP